jgi:hypothetical protein
LKRLWNRTLTEQLRDQGRAVGRNRAKAAVPQPLPIWRVQIRDVWSTSSWTGSPSKSVRVWALAVSQPCHAFAAPRGYRRSQEDGLIRSWRALETEARHSIRGCVKRQQAGSSADPARVRLLAWEWVRLGCRDATPSDLLRRGGASPKPRASGPRPSVRADIGTTP